MRENERIQEHTKKNTAHKHEHPKEKGDPIKLQKIVLYKLMQLLSSSFFRGVHELSLYNLI